MKIEIQRAHGFDGEPHITLMADGNLYNAGNLPDGVLAVLQEIVGTEEAARGIAEELAVGDRVYVKSDEGAPRLAHRYGDIDGITEAKDRLLYDVVFERGYGGTHRESFYAEELERIE